MNSAIVDKALTALHNAKGLPALERNVTSILQSITTGNADDQQLVGHIIEDAALTQQVLRLANSPMYAPFTQEAGSVSTALQVLGTDCLMHLALGTQMLSDHELAQDTSLSQTLFASELARSACPQRIEDASVATLMYDLGRLVLNRYLPEEAESINLQVANGCEASTAVSSVLGMSLEDFGTAIAQRWDLPRGIRSIIEGSGDPALVNVARLSTNVSALIHEGKADAADKLLAATQLPGIDIGRLAGLIQRKREAIAAQPVVGKRKQSTVSPARILDDLRQSLADVPSRTLDELAGVLIPSLGRTLNAAHCLLFMMTRSGDFCIRHGFGKGIEELRTRLRVSAEFKPTAFHAAIKNNVDVSITNVLKLKSSGLPDGYHQLLPSVSRFLILPIANSQVSGLLYCDWEDAGELQQDELVAIRKLRDLFLPFFPR